MSDFILRRWVCYFNNGHENDDNKWSWCPSLIGDDMIVAVNVKITENIHFTTMKLSQKFLQISRSLLYENDSDDLKFQKMSDQWVFYNLRKQQRWQSSDLDFLTHYNEEGIFRYHALHYSTDFIFSFSLFLFIIFWII